MPGNQQNINTGSGVNSGNGDTIRQATIKTEDNFTDLYQYFPLEILPHTSSDLQPSQMIGESGTDILVGVTGSVHTTKLVKANKFVVQDDPGTVPVFYSIVQTPNQSWILFRENSFTRGVTLSAAFSPLATNQVGRGIHIENQFSGVIKQVRFMGSTNNQGFRFKGQNNANLIYGDGIYNKVGIKFQPADSLQKTFTVNGSVGGNEFLASQNFPTTDPGEEGAWFNVDSDTVFGTSGFKVLCVSQGPNPLIRDGLKYMLAFGNRGGNGLLYRSPLVGTTPESYENAVRPGANLADFRDVKFPQLQNTGQLYYNVYTSSTDYNQVNRNIFVHPEESGSFIFWWKDTGGTNNSNNANRYMGSNSNFEIRRNGTQNQLILTFGANVPGYHNNNICDITNWHMIALTFNSSSGAVPFSTYIRGSGASQINKYYSQGTTTTGFNIDQGSFSIGTRNNNAAGGIFSSSLFLYYSRSLSENELDSIYSYFSGSHGL